MDNVKAAAKICRYEGFSKLPYKCPTGHLTIGYGHNLEHGISKEAAEFILQEDLARAERAVKNSFPWWWKLDDARQFVLVDMAFNMGLAGLKGFKKMLAAVEQGDYQTAAKEMLDSKWAAQVGRRAVELSKIMEKGEW
ncbi:MAG: glycoside hydrolase family protein [Elusimicrobiaceae bacterium]|uniref:glycoside hydrolase family protein n=1 Tax=Candidatus Avelusimicrobium faecicola TaxID=3416205 RepID=UPI002A77575F|nr:glycoside hydrolase family protein [Spirochaetota bacterium]MDY2939443.1 glycoside hydrolase family protein [Elusimicrobiaceae bacterium]